MKKQLILTKTDDDYILTEENSKENSIKIIKKVINGEEIYNSFYSNVNEKIQYSIETNLSDSEDKIILKQLSDLFKKIDAAVNVNCFNEKD